MTMVVFTACWETQITEEVVHEVMNVEVVICHIKLLQHKSLIVTGFEKTQLSGIFYIS